MFSFVNIDVCPISPAHLINVDKVYGSICLVDSLVELSCSLVYYILS